MQESHELFRYTRAFLTGNITRWEYVKLVIKCVYFSRTAPRYEGDSEGDDELAEAHGLHEMGDL